MNTSERETAVEAPAPIKGAYQAVVDRSRDAYHTLRLRVENALSRRRSRKVFVTEKMALRPEDVEALLWRADALALLQFEVRKQVEANGGEYSGVVEEILAALADRELLNKAQLMGMHVQPVVVHTPEGELYSAWFARPNAIDAIDRPHRTLREALYAATCAIEPFEETGAPSLVGLDGEQLRAEVAHG